MLVADLLRLLDRLAPAHLAQPGDNCGLLVGDEKAPVRRVLAALELTGPVLEEAVARSCDTVLTHHPLLFSPVSTLVESRPREALLRRLVAEHVTLIACHTNLDSARDGLAEIAAAALRLRNTAPLEHAATGWCKLVGFVPAEALEAVATAVFAAGAGGIGNYRDCAFTSQGTGWFTPGPGSEPTVGEVSRPERTPEVRWETVVPRGRLGAAIRAFVDAHPYEEPAFDVYAVEDVLGHVGLGRVGTLDAPMSVRALAEMTAQVCDLSAASWCGDGARMVSRVGVLPGSGRGLLDAALGLCEVLVTGDVTYHDAERALESGLSLVDVPHGEFEWWAFRRWVSEVLAEGLRDSSVSVGVSERWHAPWEHVSAEGGPSTPPCMDAGSDTDEMRVWIDGGSRGNPGPSAIGVVMEDLAGNVVGTVSEAIGVTTNNVAEYRALLAGLDVAAKKGSRDVEVLSDSELLVKQILGQYRVKNEGLKPLYAEAREKAAGFRSFRISHIERAKNARADGLVNRALDEQEKGGL
ncbi:MAG: Nif3-like dinuclear metal center hexameric protein [Thermoleophilia bacterium]|nr:Nif3-like dinuclear metal center hexameric protein [Thermoleophilia bacterium]